VGNENWDVIIDLDALNQVQTRYLRGDVVDELFGRVENGVALWNLNDHLGSIRDVIDISGTIVSSVRYDAFGNVISETSPSLRGRYGWTGREFDAETGLQYNRARYYDATTGRWFSLDPLGFAAGDSNLYRYVGNRATTSTDPSGLIFDSVSTFGSSEPIYHATHQVPLGTPIRDGTASNPHVEWINGRWQLRGLWVMRLHFCGDFHSFVSYTKVDGPDKGAFITLGRWAHSVRLTNTGKPHAGGGVIINHDSDVGRYRDQWSSVQVTRAIFLRDPVLYGGTGYTAVGQHCDTYSTQAWEWSSWEFSPWVTRLQGNFMPHTYLYPDLTPQVPVESGWRIWNGVNPIYMFHPVVTANNVATMAQRVWHWVWR
jgi:RHS repeat-associated protein